MFRLLSHRCGFKGTIHIAHISTEGALDAVREARRRGKIRVTCGATPHHILLNSDSESMIVKMNPPLRPESDRLAVWNALFDGTINWVESDHAPHTLEDKRNGASGIPGFEGMLLTIQALRKAGMTVARLTELFCTNALSTFCIEEKSSPVPEVTQQMLDSARADHRGNSEQRPQERGDIRGSQTHQKRNCDRPHLQGRLTRGDQAPHDPHQEGHGTRCPEGRRMGQPERKRAVQGNNLQAG